MEIVAKRVSDIGSVLAFGEIRYLGMDAELAPFLITAAVDTQGATKEFRVWRPNSRQLWTSTLLSTDGLRWPVAEPLSRGGWLQVGRRTRSKVEENVRILDPQGRRLRAFAVGDGVTDVQATPDGHIWVGYSDEGVYRSPGSVSDSGLTCFAASGELTFEFRSLWPGVPVIDDCYAMNVTGDREVWLCYYSDFPIVRLTSGKLTGMWRDLAPTGADAFAVDGERLLFGPGYDRKQSLDLVDLTSGARTTIGVLDEMGRHVDLRRPIRARSHLMFLADLEQKSLLCVDMREL
jgi:hypothetical protein